MTEIGKENNEFQRKGSYDNKPLPKQTKSHSQPQNAQRVGRVPRFLTHDTTS